MDFMLSLSYIYFSLQWRRGGGGHGFIIEEDYQSVFLHIDLLGNNQLMLFGTLPSPEYKATG